MRDVITALLEVAGILMLVVAAVLALAGWSLPAGLAVGGVLLIGAAGVVETRRPASVSRVEDDVA